MYVILHQTSRVGLRNSGIIMECLVRMQETVQSLEMAYRVGHTHVIVFASSYPERCHTEQTVDYAQRPITSRAHLLDIAEFIDRHQLPMLSFFDTSTPIPLAYLQQCAAECKITFRPGDILIVRIGFTEAYLTLSNDEQTALSQREKRGWCGVGQGIDVLQWHWDNGIIAVVSDS